MKNLCEEMHTLMVCTDEKPRLSPVEMYQAVGVGGLRRISAIKNNRVHVFGQPTVDLWTMEIEAAAAELLVAKWLGLYWHALSQDPSSLPGDAGLVQVRHSLKGYARLILHSKDADDAIFVLVTGRYPEQEIVGWTYGHEGKVGKHWMVKTGRPAYFVPQEVLYPPETLKLLFSGLTSSLNENHTSEEGLPL